MSQIVKTIKGRKYTYEVKWDPQQNKQIWTYQGKVEEKIDHEKLKRELYSATFPSRFNNRFSHKSLLDAIYKITPFFMTFSTKLTPK